MPLYEYECRACGHRFERIQKFSDPILRKCPRCKKVKLKKLLSPPAVRFKGTGWYVTDYGRKGSAGSRPDADHAKDGDKEKPAKEGPAAADRKPAKGRKKD
ncbi:MAG TPA: zinc ribbon domain-containing protein [Candidatus Polarisedimenticolia bacterium]|nr:zinc ribbon domain-containing protein [Candidatus Polarisedimenticolia bacterium]